ncbi:MAG: hypothetical protein ACJ763_06230 [Bdellovibrionia bacterium]
MTNLMDLTLKNIGRHVVARIYPVLVWGAVMGFVVHAGLKSQFSHMEADSEQISFTYSERQAVDQDIPDRVALP